MKLNATVVLTLILLVIILGAGSASAWLGFAIGYEALRGVTQPDITPAKKLASNQQTSGQEKGKTIVPEREILIRVYNYIHSKGGNLKTLTENKQENQSFIRLSDNPESRENKLPLKTSDGGVTLEVAGASQQGGSLLLDIKLKNEGRKAVRFLYSFLDVMDDRGRVLSAITDGLPGELPANSQNFAGTVRIPTALLDDARQISLTLTDYPEQKLQLKVSEIPVVR